MILVTGIAAMSHPEYDLGTAQRDALHARNLICLALIDAYRFDVASTACCETAEL
jgi:hypothetical protein